MHMHNAAVHNYMTKRVMYIFPYQEVIFFGQYIANDNISPILPKHSLCPLLHKVKYLLNNRVLYIIYN